MLEQAEFKRLARQSDLDDFSLPSCEQGGYFSHFKSYKRAAKNCVTFEKLSKIAACGFIEHCFATGRKDKKRHQKITSDDLIFEI